MLCYAKNSLNNLQFVKLVTMKSSNHVCIEILVLLQYLILCGMIRICGIHHHNCSLENISFSESSLVEDRENPPDKKSEIPQ